MPYLVGAVVAGKDRAREAAFKAFQSPLLDTGIEQASGIVWNITGPSDMTLSEVSVAYTSSTLVLPSQGFQGDTGSRRVIGVTGEWCCRGAVT